MLPRITRLIFTLAIGLIQGCASVQLISEQQVESKVAQVKVGNTTMSEVEAIFGTQHATEGQRWFYNLSDTAFEISERKTGTLSGVLPVGPGTVATNTRALITVRFADNGKVSGLEVARFFNPPFVNDYWYMIKEGAQNVRDSIVHSGEESEFRVDQSDKPSGILILQDPASNARLTVKLENQMLHIKSENPYDRLTTEYRVFTKRESAFIHKISTAHFVW